MRRLVALLSLVVIFLVASGQSGWDSRTEFQGKHIVTGSISIAAPAVSADTTVTLFFPGPGGGDSVLSVRDVFDSTTASDAEMFQWFSITCFGARCTVTVAAPSLPGDSVVYLLSESTVGGTRSTPPLPVGLDWIRIGIKTTEYALSPAKLTVMVGR